ncbi:hypothetical protein J2X36_005378 [Methylobacterium sp. BE186]|uniref:hypothetical protein n=1 Tax=Methylobacterium sp. BE186 TaxID=2817715 RepID=UPI0028659878|nr:hypothetical protein [Methylobacterium sp. BE186]MDR7040595.1 hypothetical protein [Methylobacterium sp. BE186]
MTTERIAIEPVGAAVDVYLAEPTTQAHPIGSDHILDLAAIVAAHASAPATMINAEAKEPSRRIAVRSALFMARPANRSTGRRDRFRDWCSDAPAMSLSAATGRHRRR